MIRQTDVFMTCMAVQAQTPQGPAIQLTADDWLMVGTLFFFLAAFTVFLIAYQRGLFHHAEDAKYYMLTIHEPDYYTPEWAKETLEDEPDRDLERDSELVEQNVSRHS